MAIWDVFKISRKTFFNPSGWVDLESIKLLNRTIYESLRDMFFRVSPLRQENYDEALKRLNLTEEEAQDIGKNYRLTGLFFLLLSVLSVAYTFYVLVHHRTFLGFVLGIAATALFLSQAFRYDFWAFQIREHKLGCTYQEWKESIFKKR